MTDTPDRKVYVCAECLTASCWHGEFMCQRSRTANIKTLTVAELDVLGREHPDNYSIEKVIAVHGELAP